MLDHLLGKPSSNWKRSQVLLLTFISLYYLRKYPAEGPRRLRKWNTRLERYRPWQIIMGTLTFVYALKNAFLLLGLNAPEPLARLYSRSYYRATWIVTAMDAGFWTAMPIRPKFLRDIFSLVFTLYYVLFADQADEKVRRIRATITVPQIRTSWEKALNPYFRFVTSLTRPRLGVRRPITFSRPSHKPNALEPINAWIYYGGTEKELLASDELILFYPGGGFVTMNPPCHDEYIATWAIQTKTPIVAIDYGKAPEYPYPWAIEECFDAYRSILETNGSCVGLRGNNDSSRPTRPLRIALVGDSAGGNLATAVMYKILEHETPIAPPAGIVLVYACLDFNISCWMPSEQLDLIRAGSVQSMPGLLASKDHLSHKSPLAVVPDKQHRFRKHLNTSIEDTITHRGKGTVPGPNSPALASNGEKSTKTGHILGTRLAMTSRMSFFEDRMISPDLMRAMAILYIGPNTAPNFTEDYYLSPIVGPDHLLERFPPVYMMCGEKDPFVDDTIIFGGRIRAAKRKAWKRRQDSLRRASGKKPLADDGEDGITFKSKSPRAYSNLHRNKGAVPHNADFEEFREGDHCTVKIIEGISHGYMQMLAFLPEAKGAVRMAGTWIADILDNSSHENLHDNDNSAVSSEQLALTSKQYDALVSSTQSSPEAARPTAEERSSPSTSSSSTASTVVAPTVASTQPSATDSSNRSSPSPDSVSSPRARRRQEQLEKGEVHEDERGEWERRNVISTEKELMERRRAGLGRYFAVPTSPETDPSTVKIDVNGGSVVDLSDTTKRGIAELEPVRENPNGLGIEEGGERKL